MIANQPSDVVENWRSIANTTQESLQARVKNKGNRFDVTIILITYFIFSLTFALYFLWVCREWGMMGRPIPHAIRMCVCVRERTLKRRGLGSGTCFFCTMLLEDNPHKFIKCDTAYIIWKYLQTFDKFKPVVT